MTFDFCLRLLRYQMWFDPWILLSTVMMERNEQYNLLTNVSEEEGHENLNISDLSPDLGPNFHNQVENHLV